MNSAAIKIMEVATFASVFIIAWIWRAIRPYLIFRDVRDGVIAPNYDVLIFVVLQAALFLFIPVWFLSTAHSQDVITILVLCTVFISGCSTAYYGLKTWKEIMRKRKFVQQAGPGYPPQGVGSPDP